MRSTSACHNLSIIVVVATVVGVVGDAVVLVVFVVCIVRVVRVVPVVPCCSLLRLCCQQWHQCRCSWTTAAEGDWLLRFWVGQSARSAANKE